MKKFVYILLFSNISYQYYEVCIQETRNGIGVRKAFVGQATID